jgi:uncharacterized membrane protein YbhN (UPF0104 family)
MQIINKTGLIRIVLISAVLFSIFFLISTISPSLDLRSLLLGKSRYLAVFILLAVTLHFLLEPLRWYLYTHEAQSENAARNGSFAIVFAVLSTTALFSYTLPFKLGLPTRIYLLKEYLGLVSRRIVFFLTVDGLINIAAWGLFGAASFICLLPLAGVSKGYLYVIAAAVGLFLVMLFARRLLGKLLRPLRDPEFAISTRTVVMSVTIVIIDVFGFGVRHIAIFMLLGLPINYLDGFLIGILSVFAGIASTLPLGLGAYDAALIFLLTSHGVSLDMAGVAPILNRMLNLLSSMLFGGLGSVFLMRRSLL